MTAAWAPTPDEIHAVIPARAGSGFSTTTRPSVAEVMVVVAQIVADVVSEVGAFDPSTVISDASDPDDQVTVGDMARWAASLGAASAIEGAFFPEQQQSGDQSPGGVLYQRYKDALARFKKVLEDRAAAVAAAAHPEPRYVTGSMVTPLPNARRHRICP